MTNDSINDIAIASMTTKYGMGGGVLTSIIGWLSSNEAVVIIGIIVTLLGFIINLIFQIKREKRQIKASLLEEELMKKEDQRKQALFEEQMKQLKGKQND